MVALNAFPEGVCELDSGAAAGRWLSTPSWLSELEDQEIAENATRLQLGAGDGGGIVLDVFY